MTDNEHVIPPDDKEDDEDASPAFQNPVYPRITRSQWALLNAMSTGNCKDMIDAAVFYGKLSTEAKEWLAKADAEKMSLLNSTLTFFANSKVIWKFLLVGGGMLAGGFITVAGVIKIFGDYFTVKIK